MASSTVSEKRSSQRTANGSNGSVAVFDTTSEPTRLTDRVRWGAILAGLVTALSTLVLLSILGLAIGLTTYETGDQLRNFGLGAGIWGAVSTIVAFVLGGWVAAHSAGVRGRSNALLNGAMVWAVAMPLIMYLLGSGAGSLMNTATNAAAASVPALTQNANGTDVTAAANAAQAQAQQVDPATVDAAAQKAGNAAWGTLVALLLGLVAAVGGGLMGQRREEELYQDTVVS